MTSNGQQLDHGEQQVFVLRVLCQHLLVSLAGVVFLTLLHVEQRETVRSRKISRLDLQRLFERRTAVLEIAHRYVHHPLGSIGERITGLLLFEPVGRRERFVELALAKMCGDQREVRLVMRSIGVGQRLQIPDGTCCIARRDPNLREPHFGLLAALVELACVLIDFARLGQVAGCQIGLTRRSQERDIVGRTAERRLRGIDCLSCTPAAQISQREHPPRVNSAGRLRDDLTQRVLGCVE